VLFFGLFQLLRSPPPPVNFFADTLGCQLIKKLYEIFVCSRAAVATVAVVRE